MEGQCVAGNLDGPILMGKGYVHDCGNSRAIILKSCRIKPWEKIVDRHIRPESTISANQFGFRPENSTMVPISIPSQLWREIRQQGIMLYLVFVIVKKGYDHSHRPKLWDALRNMDSIQAILE